MPRSASHPVVVTGEALVDLVLAPDGHVAAHPGGGPYNVARTLGRLGEDVAYLGRLSRDRFGGELRRGLAADGVDCSAVVDTDDPTTLALAELDDEGGASYRFYDAGTAAAGLTPRDAAASLPEAMATFYLGTLGLVLEPLASTLEGLLGGLSEDVVVALDPNCRPSAIADEGAYRGRLDRVLARTDLVKASEEDLAWLRPGADPAGAARDLLAGDGAVAVVTRGPRGALVVSRDETREVEAPQVDVVDTIGAGDAFMGALLAHLLRHGAGREGLADVDEVARAAAFACRVAAVTCSRAGADPPRADEL